MSGKNPFPRYLFFLTLLVFMALACGFGSDDEPPPSYVPPTLEPTPMCGGDVSGTWDGGAGFGDERQPYSLTLVQTGCTVTGTSTSWGQCTARVNGTVDKGIFHYSESGSESCCYWSADLTLVIAPKGRDTLSGEVTNCSKKFISLER